MLNPLSTLLHIRAGTNSPLPRGQSGRPFCIGKRSVRQPFKFQSESIPADVCLGVLIAGVNVLIGIALIIAFI
jgi:hypothetical protein